VGGETGLRRRRAVLLFPETYLSVVPHGFVPSSIAPADLPFSPDMPRTSQKCRIIMTFRSFKGAAATSERL
jgi:hypothetical protein